MAEDLTLGVALSGGGHRATVFGLGALLYLVDAGKSSRVVALSSVSGGSIANAYVAQGCDFSQVGPDEFDLVASGLLTKITRAGVFTNWLWRAYLGLMLLAILAIFSICIWSFPIAASGLQCFAALVLWGAAWLLRGAVIDRLFGFVFFAPTGTSTRLAHLKRAVGHIFCATSLTDGAPFYFIGWKDGFLYTRQLGLAPAGEVRLQTAVRASAAFPGAFPPKRLRTTRLAFTVHGRSGPKPPALFLADGGVWNNLGTQWFEDVNQVWNAASPRGQKGPGHGHRSEWPGILVDQQLIVDASAPLETSREAWLRMPLLGEIKALTRSLALIYYNTVGPRISSIQEEIRRSRRADLPRGNRPATVSGTAVASLTEGLGAFAESFTLRNPPPARDPNSVPFTETRALRWLEYLWSCGDGITVPGSPLEGEEYLRDLQESCARVPTGLSRLEELDALSLLVCGYLNAMQVCHVAFDYQLVPLQLERFRRLFPAPLEVPKDAGSRAWLFEELILGEQHSG